MPTRILVADDHTIVRTSIARLLSGEDDLCVVGEAVNGQDAVEKAWQLRPDVVLMDVTMPVLNGIEATRRIVEVCPEVKVIGLSMHNGDTMAGTMLQAGAVAYVTKNAPAEDLLAAVRAAC